MRRKGPLSLSAHDQIPRGTRWPKPVTGGRNRPLDVDPVRVNNSGADHIPSLTVNPATDTNWRNALGFSAIIADVVVRPLPVGCRCPRLRRASDYNDTVAIESYRPAPFLFADKKRNGIRYPLACSRDLKERSKRARAELSARGE